MDTKKSNLAAVKNFAKYPFYKVEKTLKRATNSKFMEKILKKPKTYKNRKCVTDISNSLNNNNIIIYEGEVVNNTSTTPKQSIIDIVNSKNFDELITFNNNKIIVDIEFYKYIKSCIIKDKQFNNPAQCSNNVDLECKNDKCAGKFCIKDNKLIKFLKKRKEKIELLYNEIKSMKTIFDISLSNNNHSKLFEILNNPDYWFPQDSKLNLKASSIYIKISSCNNKADNTVTKLTMIIKDEDNKIKKFLFKKTDGKLELLRKYKQGTTNKCNNENATYIQINETNISNFITSNNINEYKLYLPIKYINPQTYTSNKKVTMQPNPSYTPMKNLSSPPHAYENILPAYNNINQSSTPQPIKNTISIKDIDKSGNTDIYILYKNKEKQIKQIESTQLKEKEYNFLKISSPSDEIKEKLEPFLEEGKNYMIIEKSGTGENTLLNFGTNNNDTVLRVLFEQKKQSGGDYKTGTENYKNNYLNYIKALYDACIKTNTTSEITIDKTQESITIDFSSFKDYMVEVISNDIIEGDNNRILLTVMKKYSGTLNDVIKYQINVNRKTVNFHMDYFSLDALKYLLRKLNDLKEKITLLNSDGYYHCDLKPDNIFWDGENKRFVLGDLDNMGIIFNNNIVFFASKQNTSLMFRDIKKNNIINIFTAENANYLRYVDMSSYIKLILDIITKFFYNEIIKSNFDKFIYYLFFQETQQKTNTEIPLQDYHSLVKDILDDTKMSNIDKVYNSIYNSNNGYIHNNDSSAELCNNFFKEYDIKTIREKIVTLPDNSGTQSLNDNTSTISYLLAKNDVTKTTNLTGYESMEDVTLPSTSKPLYMPMTQSTNAGGGKITKKRKTKKTKKRKTTRRRN